MKKLIFLLGMFFLAGQASDFQIFKDGKPQAVIVAPKEVFGLDRWCQSFIRHVHQCTGCALQLRQIPDPEMNNIVINPEKRRVEDDSFSIDFPDDRTMRITGSINSIHYALCYLLEEYFGVRFLMQYPRYLKRPDCYPAELETVYPPVKNAAVRRTALRKEASLNFFRFLNAYYWDWKTRPTSFSEGHLMTEYAFPAKKYAPDNSWPQEILPVHNGKKYRPPRFNPKAKKPYAAYVARWQPCWSNPKTAEIAVANILERLEKEPWRFGNKNIPLYNVVLSVNDNGGMCECEKCRAAVAGKRNAIGRLNYSELYWTWVKEVAEKVAEKYPDIYILAYAYREVYDPPSFKLPSNVIVELCRELIIGGIDSEQKAAIRKTFEEWGKKSSLLFLYDYYENTPPAKKGYSYVLPRLHMKTYAEMLRMAYQNNLRGIYLESSHMIPISGPGLYICARLFFDINTDVKAVFRDWCEKAVGLKAAPYLMDYYLFWENYWQRPEIRQTNWAASARGTYLAMGEAGTYTYPLTVKDLEKTRSLLEKVVAYAGTPLEKKRAEFFRRLYEISVNCVNCLYSVHIQPDGTVASSKDAVAMVNSIPLAMRSLDALKNEPLVPLSFIGIAERGLVNLRPLFRYKDDPAVKAAVTELLKNKELTPALKGNLAVLSGQKFKNLVANGSFENAGDRSFYLRPKTGKLDSAHVSDGKKAFKAVNGAVKFYVDKPVTGKYYIIMVDVYSPVNGGEGRISMWCNPRSGNTDTQNNRMIMPVSKGWQTIANTIQVTTYSPKLPVDNLFIRLVADKFEKNEPLWFDNVRVYQLD